MQVINKLGVLALTGAAAFGSGIVAPAPVVAATTTTTTSPVKAAAGWLAGQLIGTDADHYDYGSFPGHDYGNTADGVLAMDAAHVAQAAAARATAFLRTGAKDYATGGGYTAHYYPGALGKLLLVATAQHADPADFGGINLPQSLRDEEQADGAYDNVDDSGYGESVVDQSFALIALAHTGTAADAPDAKAVQWLEGQECGDGSFQYSPQTTPAATCTDFDTTAYAAQALVAVSSSKAAASLDWIVAHANADGGFGTGGSNANSTAVAVQALLAGGRSATKGLAWLRAREQGCAAPASRRGAISFKPAWDASAALRATTQATQALALAPLGSATSTSAVLTAPVLSCAVAKPVSHPVPSPASGGGTTRSNSGSAAVRGLHEGTGVAVLPVTGPAPLAPTLGIAFDLFLVGGGLLLAGRRRRRA